LQFITVSSVATGL
nr:immunoglobulin light chain junction region [Homo sapiens]